LPTSAIRPSARYAALRVIRRRCVPIATPISIDSLARPHAKLAGIRWSIAPIPVRIAMGRGSLRLTASCDWVFSAIHCERWCIALNIDTAGRWRSFWRID
jgi:hypothetical protein